MRRILLLTTCFGILAVAASCNDDGRTLRSPRPDQNASVSSLAPATDSGELFDTTVPVLPIDTALTVTAPWRDGAPINVRHSCDGANLSPPLIWSPAPAGTAEIAITMVDDDAPEFVHWALAGIGPDATRIAEGEVPEGAFAATNSSGGIGYTGPCPPSGSTHTYRFTVHYLDQQLDLGDGVAGADLLLAIDAATIEFAEITSTYSRP